MCPFYGYSAPEKIKEICRCLILIFCFVIRKMTLLTLFCFATSLYRDLLYFMSHQARRIFLGGGLYPMLLGGGLEG